MLDRNTFFKFKAKMQCCGFAWIRFDLAVLDRDPYCD
jgi:hypothetical protein